MEWNSGILLAAGLGSMLEQELGTESQARKKSKSELTCENQFTKKLLQIFVIGAMTNKPT